MSKDRICEGIKNMPLIGHIDEIGNIFDTNYKFIGVRYWDNSIGAYKINLEIKEPIK